LQNVVRALSAAQLRNYFILALLLFSVVVLRIVVNIPGPEFAQFSPVVALFFEIYASNIVNKNNVTFSEPLLMFVLKRPNVIVPLSFLFTY